MVLQNPRMAHRCCPYILLLACVGLNLAQVPPARAGLGYDAASVQSDADDLHGVAQVTSLRQYAVYEIDSGSGMQVREYVDRSGTVFAIAWVGPAVPDLRGLLGMHFAAYSEALARMSLPGRHRMLRVASPELVVESDGHLRAYRGRAYLPALVPAGIAAADLH